jgi:hypothetical protein
MAGMLDSNACHYKIFVIARHQMKILQHYYDMIPDRPFFPSLPARSTFGKTIEHYSLKNFCVPSKLIWDLTHSTREAAIPNFDIRR